MVFIAPFQPVYGVPAADLTGKWELSMKFPDAGVVQMVMGTMDLTESGPKIAGSINGRPVKGTFDGSNINFTINFEASIPQGIDVDFSGKLSAKDTLTGVVTFPQYGKGTWTLKKQ